MRTIKSSAPPVQRGPVFVWHPNASETREPLAKRGDLSVVGLRVDGLTIAAVVELDRARLNAWRFCSVGELPEGGLGPERASESGVVRVHLDGWGGEVRHVDLEVRPLRGDRWKFRNADVRGIVDEHPLAGCALEVTFTQGFLAANDLSSGLAEAYVRAIGATLGLVRELRVRRLDMAADVAGWAIKAGDRDAWVKPGRSPLSSYVELPDADEVKEHGHSRRLTGHTIGAGGPLLLRVYDKRTHLAEREPEKRQGEEEIWRSRGWDGSGPVTRVEFQLRSEVLRSFGIESPEGLHEKLDAVWQYVTHRWARMVVPGSATRLSRCDVDDRWKILQSVKFLHTSLPAARRYFSAGVTARQALGGMLSFVASRGDREGVQFVYLTPSTSEEEARSILEIMTMRWLSAGGRAMCDQLVALLGTARATVEYLNARGASALARADSIGVEAAPPELEAPAPRRRRPSVALWETKRAA